MFRVYYVRSTEAIELFEYFKTNNISYLPYYVDKNYYYRKKKTFNEFTLTKNQLSTILGISNIDRLPQVTFNGELIGNFRKTKEFIENKNHL